MKKSILVAFVATVFVSLTQAAAPGRGGGSFGAMPHFSSAAHFARPAQIGPVRGITGSRPITNIPRTQPNVRYVHPLTMTGSHLPPRSWATNSEPRTTRPTAAIPRTTTTVPANRNLQNSNNRLSFAEATRRYDHARHDRDFWRRHYSNIVQVDGGYYYWDSGFWFPAWGYDPSYDTYPYDGPIYGFDGLNPDQVVTDVQIQLQQEGYYNGPINGILDQPTQAAIANYQRNNNLAITAVVDAATVTSLGLG
jgi:hypothetical protein